MPRDVNSKIICGGNGLESSSSAVLYIAKMITDSLSMGPMLLFVFLPSDRKAGRRNVTFFADFPLTFG